MKRLFLFILTLGSLLLVPYSAMADETVTVTATSSDVSENLDLKTVATLFGQAKDLEQFEQMLNNPDSAFSNLDLNSDGEVDYLRVIETADNNRHLVVIQAVLAKDIYQDVASIFVEKDENNQVTVQVIGDEYIYGENYIIEPVYIYRPMIYDWFWGSAWVCWHSPYYWGYWPNWWHPYYCVDPFVYWDHCYWHHYHYPICSYRTGHHHHPHYRPMREPVRRNDFAKHHPERSFATRNVSRNITNARALEQTRRTATREAVTSRPAISRSAATRVNVASTATRVNATPAVTRGNAQTTRNATYNSSNIRSAATATRATAVRTAATDNRPTAVATRPQSTTQRVATPSRSTDIRKSATVCTQPTRTSVTTSTTPMRTSSTVHSASTASPSRSSSTAVRTASTTTRSSATSVRSSGTMRPAGTMSPATSRPASTSSRSAGGSMRTR